MDVKLDSSQAGAQLPTSLVPRSEPRFGALGDGPVKAEWVEADGAAEDSVIENFQSIQQGTTLLVQLEEGERWGFYRWARKDRETYDERPDVERSVLTIPDLTQTLTATHWPRLKRIIREAGIPASDLDVIARSHAWLFMHEHAVEEWLNADTSELSEADSAWVRAFRRAMVRGTPWLFSDDYRVCGKRISPTVMAVFGRRVDEGSLGGPYYPICQCPKGHLADCPWHGLAPNERPTRSGRYLRLINAGRRRPETIVGEIAKELEKELPGGRLAKVATTRSLSESIDDVRDNRTELQEVLPAEAHSSGHIDLDPDVEQRLSRLLKDYQMSLLRLKVQRLPSKEIAARLGRTVTWVDTTWLRVKRELRKARAVGFSIPASVDRF
jgi:hypothetical protein